MPSPGKRCSERKAGRESRVWSLLLRYLAQSERDYRRAIEDFDRLKQLRGIFPNEPNMPTQPEQPEDLADLSELNTRARPTPANSRTDAPASPAPFRNVAPSGVPR